jgi:hypothetical protein
MRESVRRGEGICDSLCQCGVGLADTAEGPGLLLLVGRHGLLVEEMAERGRGGGVWQKEGGGRLGVGRSPQQRTVHWDANLRPRHAALRRSPPIPTH